MRDDADHLNEFRLWRPDANQNPSANGRLFRKRLGGKELIDHDELFAQWRLRHVLMVERQIGAKSGTGGSTGASYLRATLDKRFYPELWDLRSYL